MPSLKKFFLVVALALAKTAFASNEDENLLSNKARWPPKRERRRTPTKTKIRDVYDFTRTNEYEKHVRVFLINTCTSDAHTTCSGCGMCKMWNRSFVKRRSLRIRIRIRLERSMKPSRENACNFSRTCHFLCQGCRADCSRSTPRRRDFFTYTAIGWSILIPCFACIVNGTRRYTV